LVHGLTGNSRWWSRVIDELPPDIGLVSLDVRGRGGSRHAPPPFDLATVSDDIARCLDHLGVDKAVVAGYSMGGWIAAIFGRDHGERVERLVLVDGGLPLPLHPSGGADQTIEAVVGPSLARLKLDFTSEESFFDYWRAHPALERHWDDAMKSALGFELRTVDGGFELMINPEAVRAGAIQITVDPATIDAGANLDLPVHLIVVERGTADQPGGMIPLRVAEEAARANPNLTMEYLAGVNHYTLVLGAGAPSVAAAIASQ
jgi:pimeloyl-ACP methyl ester carboxylesterase